MGEVEKQKTDLTLDELKTSSYKCTDLVLADLMSAFRLGLTIKEACAIAKINPDTYTEWSNCSTQFREKMQEARSQFGISLKIPVHKKAIGVKDKEGKYIEEPDLETAKWLLERKFKSEYSLRQELTGEDGEALITKIDVNIINTPKTQADLESIDPNEVINRGIDGNSSD